MQQALREPCRRTTSSAANPISRSVSDQAGSGVVVSTLLTVTFADDLTFDVAAARWRIAPTHRRSGQAWRWATGPGVTHRDYGVPEMRRGWSYDRPLGAGLLPRVLG